MRFYEVKNFLENQAFSAILFLYKEVLGIDMSSWNIQALRAQERKHIPQVLTKDEVKKVIDNLTNNYQLIVYLMYGCGLRMKNVAKDLRRDCEGTYIFRKWRVYSHL